MENHDIEKIDPWTNERFIPKRSNQKFACTENKIAFNNHLAKVIRNKLEMRDKPLHENHKILTALMGNNFHKNTSFDYLLGAGINFDYYTEHWIEDDGEIIVIYDFIIHKTEYEIGVYNMESPTNLYGFS